MTATRQLGLTPEQLEARKSGIGGSDAAAVVGANPFTRPIDLYREKVGETGPKEQTPAMKRGIYLEPVAAELYSKLTGRRVRRVNRTLRHPSFPWMLAHLDRQIEGANGLSDELEMLGPGVLEIKCPNVRVFARIKREGLPLYYSIQLQHSMAVAGRSWGSFALFNSDLWELIHFDVRRDDEFIAKLSAEEQKFWLNHVQKRVPPPEVQVEFKVELEEVGAGELILRNDPDWQEAVRNYREATMLKADAENLVESGKEKLKELMGHKGVVEGAGVRVYWRDRAGSRTFDKKALERAKPLDRTAVALHLQGVVENGLLAGLLEGCDLDLTAFDKVGAPSTPFRAYPVKVEREPED